MNLSPFFQGKVVIVTGSSRGIGRETARLALQWGARVVLNGRDAISVERTRQALGGGERLLAVPGDLARPERAQALVARTLEAWGTLDAVILNAGLSMRGAFAELSDTTIQTMVDANLLSAVWTARAAIPALRESRGSLLFVSSLAAIRGFPGVSLYSATKMALTGLQQSLRTEEGPRGVAVGMVHLAFTENDREKSVLAADGHWFHHRRRWTTTQQQAARCLLRAIRDRRRSVIVTGTGRLLDWAQRWFPGVVDSFVKASGGKLHHVEENSL